MGNLQEYDTFGKLRKIANAITESISSTTSIQYISTQI